jgi:hypothetical protein
MTPDIASILRESIALCPSPRPRYTMLLRLTVVDVVDAYYSTTTSHHLAFARKTMLQEVEGCRKWCHGPIQKIQILVFP